MAKGICTKAAVQGIAVMVDAAQSFGHIPVDVKSLDCDILAFSPHKMFGSNGIGALYAKAGRLDEMQPLLLGGAMVDNVNDGDSIWMPYPAKFKAGSQNLADALGFAAAVNWNNVTGMVAMHMHVTDVTRYALDSLLKLNDVDIYGPRSAAQRGVAIRAGHHCCQPLMGNLRIAATASFAPYNNRNDVDALVESIHAAKVMMT
ncbi:MAG: cysteine desulfurase/selenocysteine lyase [Paraglaciecola sp.]|jgi:cysteine desulfurase/selenocysteine lyase